MNFSDVAEPHRRELLAHCYRMLGSLDDAEDAVQETLLRGFRAYGQFKGDSSVRVWLYRIATNVCLTARSRSKDVGPILDELVVDESPSPESIAVERESLRLALVTSLQQLPGRQRAVLILREVLGFPAAEVATMLDTSVAAVKSTLQRARARLTDLPDELEPLSVEAQALLAQYMAGFERSDLSTLEKALRADAAIDLVGTGTWFAGKERCVAFLATVLDAPGDWRMAPILANGQPAVVAWFRGELFGGAVLTVAKGGITRITVFAEPAVFRRSASFNDSAASRPSPSLNDSAASRPSPSLNDSAASRPSPSLNDSAASRPSAS
jgi:RNA polymerase sigma-70 factor (ECF subfamily)